MRHMNCMIYEAAHNLQCCQFRYLLLIERLYKAKSEAEDSGELSAAEAAALRVVSDAADQPIIVASDIQARLRVPYRSKTYIRQSNSLRSRYCY